MKKVSLSGSLRENVGKKDATNLRRSRRVPAVLYGGEKQVHFSFSLLDAESLIYTPDVFQIELDVDGQKYSAIVQEAQHHPVTDKIVHLDLLELQDDKEVKIKIPVRIEGTSEGVKQGGKLSQNFRKLKVSGLASNLPEQLTINIEKLNIGDAIRVRNLEIDGINFLEAASAVVVSVKMARGAKVSDEEEEEAAAE